MNHDTSHEDGNPAINGVTCGRQSRERVSASIYPPLPYPFVFGSGITQRDRQSSPRPHRDRDEHRRIGDTKHLLSE